MVLTFSCSENTEGKLFILLSRTNVYTIYNILFQILTSVQTTCWNVTLQDYEFLM